MELKHTNSKCEDVIASELNYVEHFFEKLWKLDSKTHPINYFLKNLLRLTIK